MKIFLKKYKISVGIIFVALVAFVVFYYVFVYEKVVVTVDPKPKVEEEPLFIEVTSLSHSYKLQGLHGRLGSFSESFSGTGWKNKEQTSVYHDLNSLSISLPIDYAMNSVATTTFFNESEGYDNDEVCIKSRCIFLDKGKIYKKDRDKGRDYKNLVELDFEVEAIGRAGSFWFLATFAEKDKKDLKSGEKKITSVIYAYDGKKYKKIIGEEFLKSDFKGRFLLGGTDLEFVAGFYGYNSKILKFKRNAKCTNNIISFFKYYKVIDHLTACYAAKDVSHWFSSRMAGLRGVRFFKNGEVYVFHSDKSPFFAIANNDFLIDLTEKLKLDGFRQVFVKNNKGKIMLSAANGAKKELFEFVFKGFDKSKTVSWVSSNLTKKKIKGATIVSYTGYKDGGDIEFYFSVNGKDWQEAEPGKNVYFAKYGKDPEFYWRADIVPKEDNPATSPFLSKVSMSYVK